MVLVNGEPMATESPITVVRVDQYMPVDCRAWTNMVYEPKFANDAFAFQESVAEMRQCLDRAKADSVKTKPPEPVVTDDVHQEALAMARTPMFVSKSSNIEVAPMLGVEFVDSVKYRAFIGARSEPGENAAMASAGPMACAPQDMMTISTATAGDEVITIEEVTNPQCQRDANCLCDPT